MTDAEDEGGDGGGQNEELDRLLREARNGSREARDGLFAHVQRYLTFLAGRHHNPQLSAKAGASDIVQQTMMQAAGEFDAFRGTTAAQFRGWLRQILINEVRGLKRHFAAQRRNAGREFRLETGDTSGQFQPTPAAESLTPSREMMAAEESQRLHSILEKMSPEMRQVIQLRNWERLQFGEIAERMGISLSSAAKLWYRALIELQRLHAESADDE